MPRRRNITPVMGTKDTVTAAPSKPYQWRASGRTRHTYLLAAGLGTGEIGSAPPRRTQRSRMTRADLDAAIAALKALRDQVTP